MLFLTDVGHGHCEKGKDRHGGNPPICRRGFTRC